MIVLNEYLNSLPYWMHVATLAFVIAIYAHLFLGFWMVRRKLPGHVIKYFVFRTSLIFTFILMRSEYGSYGIIDLFFPIYIVSYIDGLIILQGFGFYRCKGLMQALKKIIRFNSVKK